MSKTVVPAVSVDVFKKKLAAYKKLIDADIEKYSAELVASTAEQFGPYSAESMKIFCDVMSRGGKRIRGALTMLAYEMFGGKDQDVAIKAARIMEIIQTYLLVVDDVYDRSGTRRGSPTAHVMLEQLHATKHWKADAHHFGESIAINAGIIGSHTAMIQLTKLEISSEFLLRAVRILNENLVVTGEGQANDIFNEAIETVDQAQIENVLIWKTAYYTFANPLQFGAVLAGASDKELEQLLDYSIQAGRVFQITDDVLGTFGNEFESGKSPMDDIKEGKRTLLTVYTLQHAPKEDAYFIERMLGNQDITAHEFKRCKDIMFACGSYEYATQQASQSADMAIESVKLYWTNQETYAGFLTGLVEYLLGRKS